MENVQELQCDGTSFPNAIVGHMAAETVICHNVMTSGQLPRDMGWSNEVYRDADEVLGPKDAYYVTSSMSCAQFRDLIERGNYKKLQDYLDDEFGEGTTFASIELAHQRGPGRLPALRHEPHHGRRARLVRQARRAAGGHHGELGST